MKFGNKEVSPMEALLRSELARSARIVGLDLPHPAHDKAVETGLCALAEGHSFDVAVEVARTVLSQPCAA